MRFAYLLGGATAATLRPVLLHAFHKSGRKIIYTAPSDIIKKARSSTRHKRQKKWKKYSMAKEELADAGASLPVHQRDMGGMWSSDRRQLYFIGIIDVLTYYGTFKRLEAQLQMVLLELLTAWRFTTTAPVAVLAIPHILQRRRVPTRVQRLQSATRRG